jgi:OOP family OmpA-OmpF porin
MKGNNYFYGFSVALLGSVLAAPAVASEGFYLGVSAGYTESDESCDDLDDIGFVGSCDDSDTGWKLTGGYQFSQYFATEISYVDLGDIDASGLIGAIPTTANVDIDGYGISLVGTYPMGDKFSLLGRVGAFNWDADVSASLGAAAASTDDDGTDLTYGLGAQYVFTDNAALRLEWERFDLDDDEVDMISLGVKWSF